jgi:uncharacterized protein (DUF1800 family)
MREDPEVLLRRRRLIERASFGPQPGAIAALAAEGERAWLARQLAPAAIPDDEAEARLAALARRELEPGDLDAPVRDPSLRGGDEGDRREAFLGLRERFRRAAGFAVGARLIRAVHGRRELLEVMVDFWANHFSVSARKGPVGIWLDAYEREALRPHALGRFEELLLAVAQSPAMLFFLDNVRSGVPRAEWPLRLMGLRERAPTGINENHARELLELHTLGVAGGYSQADVIDAARALTGWSIDRDTQRFTFRRFLHDREPKRFLGRRVPGEGEEEGRWLLRELARHEETARFVSAKLVRRFVADDPPPRLVERAAARWLETQGSIAHVLEAILLSDELAGPGARKLKTPLELAASALRATGGATDGGDALRRRLAGLGELPFLAPTPEGWPDTADAWATPAGMLGRIALAFELAGGELEGSALGDALPEGLDAAPGARGAERVASAIAAPEFQWQ